MKHEPARRDLIAHRLATASPSAITRIRPGRAWTVPARPHGAGAQGNWVAL